MKKLDKKRDLIVGQIDKLSKQQQKPEFQRMPEQVQQKSKEDLKEFKSELEAIDGAKRNFESIRDA